MGGRASALLVSVACTAGGLLLYHLATERRSAGPGEPVGASAEEVAALRREVAALGRRAPPAAQADASALTERLAALEARIVRLEGPGRVPDTTPPLSDLLSSPAGTGATEEQLATLKAMLGEIEARARRDQETDRLRAVVRASGAQVTADAEAAAIEALRRFHDQVAALFAAGSAGAAPEKRSETFARGRAIREGLARDLRDLLPESSAEKILATLPTFEDPAAAGAPKDPAPLPHPPSPAPWRPPPTSPAMSADDGK